MLSHEQGSAVDSVAARLQSYSHNILTVVFGLLPLFFIPIIAAPFEYSKVLFVLIGVTASLILFSLSALRSGTFSLGVPAALWSLWGVVAVLLVSSVLSGNFYDSFVGDFFDIHSTAFVGVLALIMTVWVLTTAGKMSIMRTYMLLAASTLVLVLFHVLRILFGSDLLSVGIFNSAVSTPVGGWNDLALFLGLSILLSLVALEQLPLTKWGRRLFGIVSAAALFMLAVINFFSVWIVLGLVSLVMLVYTLGKNRNGAQQKLIVEKKVQTSSMTLSLAVFVVSILFIIGGSAIGGFINKYTGISYIEVRPSAEATVDIARGVYGENAFLGTGPNKFTDAWRLFKQDEINRTAFWNVNFNSGFGYIPTFFVTAGVLGGIAWLLFLGFFVVTGVRFLVKTPDADRMWYFIASSSFLSAVYIWGMSLLHVPGATMLMLGALCTGITFVAYGALNPDKSRTFVIGADRRTGFILSLVVIMIIVGSVSTLYVTGRHYAAAYTFTDGMIMAQTGGTLDEVQNKMLSAYNLSGSDLFARRIAEYQSARMRALLSLTELNEAEQQQFSDALTNGIAFGNRVVEIDAENPENWSVLGGMYSLLVSVDNTGPYYDRALEALTRARDLDPQNPLRYLALAELEARAGNFESAKALAGDALGRKADYSDAFFFLMQIALATGDMEQAAASAQAMVTLDPRDQARHYQLGVLEYAREEYESAVLALNEAVSIDADYANARYYLALALEKLDQTAAAKEQLEYVLKLNPENQHVQDLIAALDAGTPFSLPAVQNEPVVSESAAVSGEGGAVTTTEEPDTDLISPVNTAPTVEETPEPVVEEAAVPEDTETPVEDVVEETVTEGEAQ